MKQEYISPEIEIIEFETEDVIQNSEIMDEIAGAGGSHESFEEGE